MSTEPDGKEFGKHTTFLTGRIEGMAYETERICLTVDWLESTIAFRRRSIQVSSESVVQTRGSGNRSSHGGDSNLDWQTVILEAIV